MVTNDESHGAAADGTGNSRDEASTSGAWWDRPIYSGKVRDLFGAPGGELVMVTTDRLSGFDVVVGEAVPTKGRGGCVGHPGAGGPGPGPAARSGAPG